MSLFRYAIAHLNKPIHSSADRWYRGKIFGKTDGISIKEPNHTDMAYEELPKEKSAREKRFASMTLRTIINLHIYDKDLKAFISAENVGPQLAKEIDETYGKTNMTPFL